MGFWNSNIRKPRSFNHQYIYSDPRKEKLQKMEEDAKRSLELNSKQDKEASFEHLRGKFSEKSVHLKRYQKQPIKRIIVLLLLIVLIVFLCSFLFTGQFFTL